MSRNVTLSQLLSVKDEENLTYEDDLIIQRNICFIDLFSSFLSNPNMYIYKNRNQNSFFDCDYLHLLIEGNSGYYLGLVGNQENIFYSFNSIIKDETLQLHLGCKKLNVNIEIINKEDFGINKSHKIYESKRATNKFVGTNSVVQRNPINFRRYINKLQNNFPQYSISIDKKQRLSIFENEKMLLQKHKLNSYNTV